MGTINEKKGNTTTCIKPIKETKRPVAPENTQRPLHFTKWEFILMNVLFWCIALFGTSCFGLLFLRDLMGVEQGKLREVLRDVLIEILGNSP